MTNELTIPMELLALIPEKGLWAMRSKRYPEPRYGYSALTGLAHVWESEADCLAALTSKHYHVWWEPIAVTLDDLRGYEYEDVNGAKHLLVGAMLCDERWMEITRMAFR